jgi:hypothetical protein
MESGLGMNLGKELFRFTLFQRACQQGRIGRKAAVTAG